MSKCKVDFVIEESICKTKSILVRCYNVNVDTLIPPLIHDTQEKINQVLDSNTSKHFHIMPYFMKVNVNGYDLSLHYFKILLVFFINQVFNENPGY